MSLMSVVCSQVQTSVSGLSLVYRSLTECSVSEYDREDSLMRRRQPTRGCGSTEKKLYDRKCTLLYPLPRNVQTANCTRSHPVTKT